MLLHPIPLYTRLNRLEGNTRVSTWLSTRDVQDLFGQDWGDTGTTLANCRILEVVALPKDIHRPVKLRDALVHYQLLNARYVDDLFADPAIEINLLMSGGTEYCFIYHNNLRWSEFWYCDPNYEYNDRTWIPAWLHYAGERHLYYYGTGRGADGLFYFPERTEEVRARFEDLFVDEDAGSYVPAWVFDRHGNRVRRDGPLHTHMNSTEEDRTVDMALHSDPGVMQRTGFRPAPVLLWDTPGNMDVSPLRNILHRNQQSNVLVFFHGSKQALWEGGLARYALRSFNTNLRKISWGGEEWVLVEIDHELQAAVVSRTLKPLRTEEILNLAQVIHAEELATAMNSEGGICFHGDFKEYYVATRDVLVLPNWDTTWVRGLNLRVFTDYKFDFGDGILGAWRSEPSYKQASPGFERPLSPIPPETSCTIEFTTNHQNSDWFNSNSGDRPDSMEEFCRKVMVDPELPPLKFVRPGELNWDSLAKELSETYGGNPGNIRKMLDIWTQYLHQDPLNDPNRRGSFDRKGPTSAGWSPDGLFPEGILDERGHLNMYEIAARARRLRGRDVLVHRDTGVKVYVVRRRYGIVTLQSEDGQEFVLNNDIVETVYDKEGK